MSSDAAPPLDNSCSLDNDSTSSSQGSFDSPQANQRTADPRPATDTGSSAVDDGKLNVPPYDREDYDEYIKDDLENNRVFLHIDKFIELMFNVPLSYRQEDRHRQHITSILDNSDFQHLMNTFLGKCAAGLEKPLYGDIAALHKKGLEMLDDFAPLREGSKAVKLNFSVNDPNRLCDGVFHALCGGENDPLPLHSGKDPVANNHPQVECGGYAMEQLCNMLLRSHTILTLFYKDRFQIHYYDRSSIVVSSIVSLSSQEGQELFILMLMGLRHLTCEDLGLRNVLTDSQKFYTELGSFKNQITQGSSKDWRRMFHDMELCVDSERYTLHEILFRQPGLVGRTTCAVAAKDSNEMEVVVKISYAVERRQSEVNLIARARDYYANDHEGHQWALNHLPKIFASVDFPLARRLCEFINSTEMKWVGGKTLFCEHRILRITVFEQLHPLLEQVQPSAQAQIFFDVLQAQKWLYDHARILHGDISMSNIMYRIDESGDCFGVLKDFDLASLRDDLESDTADTSTHRTGTPPFMAMDLQDPNTTDVRHLYRHDLESLFYVLVMLVVRHKIKNSNNGDVIQLADEPKLESWFDAKKTWEDLHNAKSKFCTTEKPEVIKGMIQPDFKCFEPWVTQLRRLLRQGYNAQSEALDSNMAGTEAPYSDETLGDFVKYSTFRLVMMKLDTPLKVRYEHDVRD